MESPVRVAVLGLGQRGLQHVSALWNLEREGLVRIVALVDAFEENLSPSKIEKNVQGLNAEAIHRSTDFYATLETVRPDALYVAIPPGFHGGEVFAAAKARIHLFIEKPMSLYLDEALEMEHSIRDAGVIATVGFQQRYDAKSEAIHDYLRDKRVVMMTFVGNHPLEGHSVKHTPTDRLGGPANRVWTANYEWSGSSVVEAGIHQTDLMRYWAGDIAWVQASYVHRDAEDILDGGDNPYAYSVTFGFENGAVGNLLLSRLRRVYYSDGYQSVLWTHGHLKIEGSEVVDYHYDGAYPPIEPPGRERVRHAIPIPSARNSTEAISRAFAEAIGSGDSSHLRSTFSSGMNSLAAVLGANISDKRGGERVVLSELLSDPAYAPFRRKPPMPR